MIDVIIPAYRGLAQTRRCLESVLGAPVRAPHEVVVIDDASPEAPLRAWLRELAGQRRITLLVHEDNAGFVASVNEGMRLHPERDVVLLNSDTEVAGDWLDRLAACAAAEPLAGTVTPFSNNATIASYPRFAQSNALPEGTTTAALDAVFARVNARCSVDMPTAVGFCMLVRRRCLDEIGPFDEAAFGQGYGEEVEFCLRATRGGWRHRLAADTFVYHEGEVSFGPGAPAIRERAQRIVDERHPEFRPQLADFLSRDPARPLRRAADLERLRCDRRSRVLLVAADPQDARAGPDGILRATAEEGSLLLALRPAGRRHLRLSWLDPGEEFAAQFDLAVDWTPLVELLASLDIARVRFGLAASAAQAAPPHVHFRLDEEGAEPAADAPSPEDEAALRERLLGLEHALGEARERARALEKSTFWRATAALRFLVHRAKLAAGALRRRD